MPTRLLVWSAVLSVSVCVCLAAQNPAKLTARELFYAAGRKPAPAKQAPAPATPTVPRPAAARPPAQQTPAVSGSEQTAANPAAAGQLTRTEYTPLGLRYSLLRRGGTQYDEVDVDTTFRSGDGMRLTIEANDDSYLYIVNKGSSGSWSVLFPSAQIDGGNNRIQAHRRYEVPAEGQFTFENPPGDERLFVVLSRSPEPSLEK